MAPAKKSAKKVVAKKSASKPNTAKRVTPTPSKRVKARKADNAAVESEGFGEAV